MNRSMAITRWLPVLIACCASILLLGMASHTHPQTGLHNTTASLTAVKLGPGLPGRQTATPDPAVSTQTSSPTPAATSFFNLPDSSPAPAIDCTTVIPLDNVARIEFGVTTLLQLEASFGPATYQTGRAPRYRFEEQGCVLIVTTGYDEILDAELVDYGTLGLLLATYGEPAAVGISQGNLTLLDLGLAVLFYPDVGVTAVFQVAPDDLTLDTPVASWQFRAPFALEKQATRLNARLVDWDVPAAPLPARDS